MQACAICMEELGEEETSNAHELDCGHVFHSRCIIGWFQRGQLSCPTCRADHSEMIPHLSVQARAKFIRSTIGRRKSAPRELKLMLARLRTAELEFREHSREVKSFQREHAAILRRADALRAKKHRLRYRVRKLERLVGLFQTPSLTLPSLVVQHTF